MTHPRTLLGLSRRKISPKPFGSGQIGRKLRACRARCLRVAAPFCWCSSLVRSSGLCRRSDRARRPPRSFTRPTTTMSPISSQPCRRIMLRSRRRCRVLDHLYPAILVGRSLQHRALRRSAHSVLTLNSSASIRRARRHAPARCLPARTSAHRPLSHRQVKSHQMRRHHLTKHLPRTARIENLRSSVLPLTVELPVPIAWQDRSLPLWSRRERSFRLLLSRGFGPTCLGRSRPKSQKRYMIPLPGELALSRKEPG